MFRTRKDVAIACFLIVIGFIIAGEVKDAYYDRLGARLEREREWRQSIDAALDSEDAGQKPDGKQ